MLMTGRIITALALAAVPLLTVAQRHHKPIPPAIGARPQLNHAQRSSASAAKSPWTPLTAQPTFLTSGAANPILLTDGSVLVQNAGAADWWKLTPDNKGSYINGTWNQIASMPDGYAPLYHSTAVLPDGRMIVEGGEYINNVPADSTQGAIYDPVADSWTSINPPDGWQSIGDAQSVVLANGTYMQANCCTSEMALLNSKTLTWTPTGANKFDPNDEEGWTLLPNNKVLAVDAYVPIPPFPFIPDGTNSELYDPHRGTWNTAGSTIVQLWDSGADCGETQTSFELGPAVLRPDGTVFYTGSNSCGAGNTATYDYRHGSWTPGPAFPGAFDIADGPAALEPNGKVLVMASPGIFQTGSQFFEWDGKRLLPVAGTPNTPADSSYYGNMLVLPTGQILFTDFSDDIEIYTPKASTHPQWAPLVFRTPLLLGQGHSYEIAGVGFNGVSQGAAYGDDVQAASNYPLVRITNLQTGHVSYSRTHNHSSMAVASDDLVSTHFDVSSTQERGLNELEVVANGVASWPVFVFISK